MALKIREGAEIRPYGQGSLLTSEMEVSQEVLEHLRERHPEDIIEDAEEVPAKNKWVGEGIYAELNPATGKPWTKKEALADVAEKAKANQS